MTYITISATVSLAYAPKTRIAEDSTVHTNFKFETMTNIT